MKTEYWWKLKSRFQDNENLNKYKSFLQIVFFLDQFVVEKGEGEKVRERISTQTYNEK